MLTTASTLLVYHSSDSSLLLFAARSYWALMSRRRSLRSGPCVSTWTLTWSVRSCDLSSLMICINNILNILKNLNSTPIHARRSTRCKATKFHIWFACLLYRPMQEIITTFLLESESVNIQLKCWDMSDVAERNDETLFKTLIDLFLTNFQAHC